MVNAATEVAQAWPFLAVTAGTPLFWTAAELYGYADDAVQSLCRDAGLVVDPEATLGFLPAQSELTLPAGTLRVVEVADVVTGASLPIRTTREMDALSALWRDDTGTPAAVVIDAAGLSTIQLWPAPTDAGALELFLVSTLPAVNSGAPTTNLPSIMHVLLALAVLGGAREKDGKTQLPEISNACRQINQAIIQTAIQMWRSGA